MNTAPVWPAAQRWLPFEKGEPVRSVVYFVLAAAVLGVLWYLLLVETPGIPHLLTDMEGRVPSNDHLRFAASFVITSLIVSTAFRGLIVRANRGWVPMLGLVLTLLGACLFMYVLVGMSALTEWGRKDWEELHLAYLGAIPILGLVGALSMCYVTIPMGIVSLVLLRGIDRIVRR